MLCPDCQTNQCTDLTICNDCFNKKLAAEPRDRLILDSPRVEIEDDPIDVADLLRWGRNPSC